MDLAIATAIGLRRSDRWEAIGYLLQVSPGGKRIVTVLLVVVPRIPEPIGPPTNVSILEFDLFNRPYSVQLPSVLKPIWLKLFLITEQHS